MNSIVTLTCNAFGGLIANTKTSPASVSWICYGSPIYYGLQIVLTYYSESDGFNDGDQAIIKGILVDTFDMQDGQIARDAMLVLALGMLAHIFGWYFCDTKNKVVR